MYIYIYSAERPAQGLCSARRDVCQPPSWIGRCCVSVDRASQHVRRPDAMSHDARWTPSVLQRQLLYTSPRQRPNNWVELLVELFVIFSGSVLRSIPGNA